MLRGRPQLGFELGSCEVEALASRAYDRVLEDGALPMPALAAKIERWIAREPIE